MAKSPVSNKGVSVCGVGAGGGGCQLQEAAQRKCSLLDWFERL